MNIDMSDRDSLINRSHRSEFGGNDSWFYTTLRPCLAEFLGTMLFVFLGTMATNNGAPLVAVAVAHAFAIASLVGIMAKVSGGHLNPAVSLGVFLAGEIPLARFVFYIISQLLGGLAGAGLTRLSLPYDVYVKAAGGGHELGSGVTAGEAIACEIFLTSVLLLAVLMTAVDKESQHAWAPVAIGLSVGTGILAGGAITGASMNPARSFGPAVVAYSVPELRDALWDYHYVYWVGPALGAIFSSMWYRLVLAGPDKNVIFKR